MKPFLVVILAALSVGQCGESSEVEVIPAADDVVIRTGTSFGMCVGYCVTELEITGTKATFRRISRVEPQKYPAKTCQKGLSDTKSGELKSLVQFDTFRTVPEVLGCPDCADGGAEFIEIQQGDRKHKVTFEYGKSIPGLDALVRALRSQREQFNDC